MSKGGKRKGAGRPALDPSGIPRKDRTIPLTDEEYTWVKEALAYRRQEALDQLKKLQETK